MMGIGDDPAFRCLPDTSVSRTTGTTVRARGPSVAHDRRSKMAGRRSDPTVAVTCRLPRSLLARLDAARGDIVREALERWLRAEERR